MVDLPSIRQRMQAVHDSQENLTYAWRLEQLQRLRRMVKDRWPDWQHALFQDLGKEAIEATACECSLLHAEIDLAISQLKHWTRPTPIPSPGVSFPARSKLKVRPKRGPACLILGPFNYPVLLLLQPLVSSLAAGNPTVLKPSELTPHVAQAIATAVVDYFPDSIVTTILGGVQESQQLLQEPWGLVFFTGSERVGRMVAQAAARTTTPTVLELGGQCPCYVDQHVGDLNLIANRIVWAKTLNAGQTCVSVDYLVVHREVADRLLALMVQAMERQFGLDPRASELGRIVSQSHAQRLVQMIAQVESQCRVLYGGSDQCDPAQRYVCPTFLVNPPKDCALEREEIFGPVLPIYIVGSTDEALQVLQRRSGQPLALYVFSSLSRVVQTIAAAHPSASVLQNDCMMHLASSDFAFGGLGSSGYGAYHGKAGFDTFSHSQVWMYRPAWSGSDFAWSRYHPFGKGFKSWFVPNVLLKVPPVPVLTTSWIVRGVVLYAVFRVLPISYQRTILEYLATTLESTADYVRP